MTDLATLGFAIDSSPAARAAVDLDRMQSASRTAEAAASSLSTAAKTAGTAIASAGAEAAQAAVGLDNAARSASFVANSLEGIPTFSPGLEKLSNQVAGVGQSARAAAMQAQYLGFQLNDIVVSLVSGQSPGVVMMQQGMQISQMFAPGSTISQAVQTIGSGLLTMLVNPINLAVIGVGALATGVAYMWHAWKDEGGTVEEMLKRQVQLTKELRDASGGIRAWIPSETDVPRDVARARLMAERTAESKRLEDMNADARNELIVSPIPGRYREWMTKPPYQRFSSEIVDYARSGDASRFRSDISGRIENGDAETQRLGSQLLNLTEEADGVSRAIRGMTVAIAQTSDAATQARNTSREWGESMAILTEAAGSTELAIDRVARAYERAVMSSASLEDRRTAEDARNLALRRIMREPGSFGPGDLGVREKTNLNDPVTSEAELRRMEERARHYERMNDVYRLYQTGPVLNQAESNLGRRLTEEARQFEMSRARLGDDGMRFRFSSDQAKEEEQVQKALDAARVEGADVTKRYGAENRTLEEIIRANIKAQTAATVADREREKTLERQLELLNRVGVGYQSLSDYYSVRGTDASSSVTTNPADQQFARNLRLESERIAGEMQIAQASRGLANRASRTSDRTAMDDARDRAEIVELTYVQEKLNEARNAGINVDKALVEGGPTIRQNIEEQARALRELTIEEERRAAVVRKNAFGRRLYDEARELEAERKRLGGDGMRFRFSPDQAREEAEIERELEAARKASVDVTERYGEESRTLEEIIRANARAQTEAVRADREREITLKRQLDLLERVGKGYERLDEFYRLRGTDTTESVTTNQDDIRLGRDLRIESERFDIDRNASRMGKAAAEEYRYAQERLNDARNAGINLDKSLMEGGPTLRQMIEDQARAVGGLAAEEERRAIAAQQNQQYMGVLTDANERLQTGLMEAEMLNKTAEAARRYKIEQELLNEAIRSGINLSPEDLQALREKARAIADVLEANRATEDKREFAGGILKGFISDLRNGATAGEALLNVLNKITDKLIDLATDEIMRMIFPSQGASGATSSNFGGSIFQQLFNSMFGGNPQGQAAGAAGAAASTGGLGPTAAGVATSAVGGSVPAMAVTNGGVRDQVWSFFKGKGLKDYQIAGIMGHVDAESKFNPLAKGDGGEALGLFQWNDRKDEMLDFIGGKKNLGDVDAQLRFAWHEMQTTENRSLRALQSSTDVRGATRAFGGFERARGFSWDNPENIHNWKGRYGAAQGYLSEYANGNPAAPPVTPTMPEIPQLSSATTALQNLATTAGEATQGLGNLTKTALDFVKDVGGDLMSAVKNGNGLGSWALQGVPQIPASAVNPAQFAGFGPGSWSNVGATGGAGGGILNWIMSLLGFGGFFADGGYLEPGKWGIVGERGPEPIFGGRSGATILPTGSVSSSSRGSTIINNYAGVDVHEREQMDDKGNSNQVFDLRKSKRALKNEIRTENNLKRPRNRR